MLNMLDLPYPDYGLDHEDAVSGDAYRRNDTAFPIHTRIT